jgi:hypothetical protein
MQLTSLLCKHPSIAMRIPSMKEMLVEPTFAEGRAVYSRIRDGALPTLLAQ